MRAAKLLPALALALTLQGCIRYEFDHELWLRVDGSGTVAVSGRPELWAAFKGLAAENDRAAEQAARERFERSGLRVRRTRVSRRDGRSYMLVTADFDDVNRLSGTPAFPDLKIALRRRGERLELEGAWTRPPGTPEVSRDDRQGLVAVRFHLPSKVYSHRNAIAGVERGNIIGWRGELGPALDGQPLAFGASLDSRSILWSTVGLFAAAIALALALVAATLILVVRAGRKPPGATAS
jgi:hypothetical protein